MTDYLELAKEAFDSSSAYIDANWRQDWEYSLRAFRSEHAAGSKYLSEEYKARSRLFRPKTRSIIRKNEAAGMQAMFSNKDFVNAEALDPDNQMAVAGAACLKEVVDYRLSRTIPTYEIYLGGLQDAQTTGTVVSYQYWEYQQKDGKKIKDKPCIQLRPIENIRLDGGADWLDPVGTSPYFFDIIPMYVCDVRGMMKSKDKDGKPKWKSFDDEIILKARPDVMDTTRKARLGKQQDPHEETTGIKSFDIVWVLRCFMRDSQGDDMCFYTLGTDELLTDPKPIEEEYFHGIRPYALGYAILETHKALKTSLPVMTRPLQQETNDIANQRNDNVKFVLQKRWFVARGRQVDVQSLVRGVPGGVTLLTDPNTDVKESNWPDVTSSAYVEHDRLNSEFDDLAGNFSPSTKVANNAVNDTLGGSKMAASSAGLMTEYLLNTVNETWWSKVLRQLALLEQYYETDEVVLGVCAKKAQLFPRFGLSRINDDLLSQEVVITVNASMGNPQERLAKFLAAIKAVIELINTAPPGVNVQEVSKEIFANSGYRDGERFMGGDPRLSKAMQMIQQLQGMLKGKQMEIQAGLQETQMKIASTERIEGARLQIDHSRIQGDLQLRSGELAVEHGRLQNEGVKLQLESNRKDPQIDPEIAQAEKADKLASAHLKVVQAEAVKAKIISDPQLAAAEIQSKERIEITKAGIGQDTELKKASIQAATAVETADIAAKTPKEGAAQTKQVADSSVLMAKILDRSEKTLEAITKPRKKTSKISPKGADGSHTVVTVEE